MVDFDDFDDCLTHVEVVDGVTHSELKGYLMRLGLFKMIVVRSVFDVDVGLLCGTPPN